MISDRDLNELIRERKDRYARRDATALKIRRALRGDFDITFRDLLANEDPVVANLIETGTRTYAQRIGHNPRFDCQPTVNQPQPKSEDAKKRAEKHERQLRADAHKMRLSQSILRTNYWLVAHGLACYVVKPHWRTGESVVRYRDPNGAYPGYADAYDMDVQDCLFISKVPVAHAKRMYPNLKCNEGTGDIELLEYYEYDGITIAYAGSPTRPFDNTVQASGATQILDRVPAMIEGPMVFLGMGLSPDGDLHGQFDQSLPPLIAQAKVRALQMKNIHRAVFPAKDIMASEDFEIISNGGKIADGPGAVNIYKNGQPQSQAETASPDVWRMNDQLERTIRIGGAFPAQLSGEPVATIATGKGTEALMTQVDDTARYLQSVQSDALARALHQHAVLSKHLGTEGSENYSPDSVDTFVRFYASTDPSQHIRLLQLRDTKVLSRESFADMQAEIDDPIAERSRIDAEAFQEVILAAAMQKYTQPDPMTGEYQLAKAAEIMRLVRAGESVEDAIATVEEDESDPVVPEAAPSLGDLFSGAPAPEDNTSGLVQATAGAGGGSFLGARTAL